jgi:hypothetical protein
MTRTRIPAGEATHIEPELVTLPRAQHTLGPWWLARAHPSEGTFAVGAGNSEHALILATTDDATARANARLIAAAPDLLAACRALVATIDATGGIERNEDGTDSPMGDPDWIDLADAYNAARAAIARATGE